MPQRKISSLELSPAGERQRARRMNGFVTTCSSDFSMEAAMYKRVDRGVGTGIN